MATWIQGAEYTRLIEEGWVEELAPEDYDSDAPIGGPIDMISPDGIKYRLMPDGTLEKKEPA